MLLDTNEKPIGVPILGSQAGELLSGWVGVLNGKVKKGLSFFFHLKGRACGSGEGE